MSNTDFSPESMDSLVQGMDNAARARAVEPTGSPERAAKALDIQRRSGIPAPAVYGSIEYWDNLVKQQERRSIIDASPALRTYVNSDPMAARVSADEFQDLDVLARSISTVYPKRDRDTVGAAFWRGAGEEAYSLPGNSEDSEFETFMEDLHLFSKKGRPFNIATAMTEGAIRTVWMGLEGVGRLFSGGTHAAGKGFGDIVGALGGDSKQAERELINLLNVAGIEIGMRPPVFRPIMRTAQQQRMAYEMEAMRIQAEMEARAVDKFVETVQPYKTRTRAPVLFQQFLQQNTDMSIVIDTSVLEDIYRARNITPHAGDPIFGWYPGISRVINDAEIEVPFSVYLTYIDPAVHTKLYPSIRRPGGMSIEQVKEANELLEAAIKQLGDEPTPTPVRPATRVGTEPGAVQSGFDVGGVFIEAPLRDSIDMMGDMTERPKAVVRFEGKDYTGNFHAEIVEDIRKQNDYSPEVDARLETLGEDAFFFRVGEIDVTSGYLDALRLQGSTLKAATELVDLKFIEAMAKKLGMDPEGEVFDFIIPKAIQTAEDAAKVRESLYLNGVFKTADAAGMTETQFKAYSKVIEARVEADRAAAIARAVRLAKRETSAEWKAIYDPALKRAEAEYDSRQDIVSEQLLREALPEQKLNASEFGTTYAAPKGTVSTVGRSADDVANDLGYATGEDLIKALDALARERAPRGRPIKPETHRKRWTQGKARAEAEAKFDDPIDRIEYAVDAAANDDVTRVLFDDLRAMRRQNENELSPPLSLEELRGKAKENFGNKFIGEVTKLGRFIRIIQDMGRRAEVMLLRNKPIDAFKAKNQQLIAQMDLKEAVEFDKLTKKTEALAQRYAKKPPKNVDPEFADQILQLLMNFGAPVRWPHTAEALDRLPSLRDFIVKRSWEDMVQYPVEETFLFEKGRNISSFTVNEYRAFSALLHMLDHNGRKARKVYEAGKQWDIDVVLKEMTELVRTSKPIKQNQRRQTIMPRARKAETILARVERVFDRIEEWAIRGPFQRFLIEPLNLASHNETKLLEAATQRIAKHPVQNPTKLVSNEFVTRAGDPRRLDRGDVVVMALYAGNRRTRDLLVDTLLPQEEVYGPPMESALRASREKRVLDFIDSVLTPEDWLFIEDMWGLMKWLKPQVDAMYRRVNGIAPETVEPIETLGHSGGYFRIIRDRLDLGTMPQDQLIPFEYDYKPSLPANSYTKKRTQSSDPLLVETAYSYLPTIINTMIHDVAMREAIINAHKILKDKTLQREIANRYGVEYSESIFNWLRSIANRANASDREMKGFSQMMRAMRLNFSTYTLGFNMPTILTPTWGYLAAHPLRTSWGLFNYSEFRQFGLQKSGLLVERNFYQQSDLWDIQHSILGMEGRWSKVQRNGAHLAMWAVFKIDNILATLGWNQEYWRGIRQGMSDQTAVAVADKYVRDFHGSASVVNRAALFNQGEVMRSFGLFYSWASTQYNLTRGIVERTAVATRQIKRGDYAGARRNFGVVLANSFAVILVPSLIAQPFYTEWKKDDNIFSFYVRGLLGFFAQLFPVLRDVWYYQETSQHPSGNVFYTTFVKNAQAIEKIIEATTGEAEGDVAVRRTAEAIMLDLGLPGGQISRTGAFFWNVATGDETPDTPMEWARGILRGYSQPGGTIE